MSIPAIGGVSLPTAVTGLTGATIPTPATDGASAASGGFATMLASGLDNLTQTQAKADDLAVQAATGDLTDPADYVVAATQAQLTTELTVTLRNKALEAFNEIMRMQA